MRHVGSSPLKLWVRPTSPTLGRQSLSRLTARGALRRVLSMGKSVDCTRSRKTTELGKCRKTLPKLGKQRERVGGENEEQKHPAAVGWLQGAKFGVMGTTGKETGKIEGRFKVTTGGLRITDMHRTVIAGEYQEGYITSHLHRAIHARTAENQRQRKVLEMTEEDTKDTENTKKDIYQAIYTAIHTQTAENQRQREKSWRTTEEENTLPREE